MVEVLWRQQRLHARAIKADQRISGIIDEWFIEEGDTGCGRK
jgi:hypothetical protein